MDTTYDLSGLDAAQAAGAGALLGGMLVAVAVFGIIFYVIEVIALWKIFTKAGKPGWHAIIPILNIYDIFELSWSGTIGCIVIVLAVLYGVFASIGGFLAVIGALCSLAICVLYIIDCVKLAKVFGKGGGFAVGLIFFSFIFQLILGFGSAEYVGKDE